MSDNSEERNLDYEAGTPSVVDMHSAVRREKILQPSGSESVGLWPLIFGAIILVAGGGFLFKNANGFSNSTYIETTYVPAPRPPSDGGEELVDDRPWIEKWMGEGKKVYGQCAACHMAGGEGGAGNPPLVGSEWVNGGTQRLGAILLHGVNGPLTVAGQSYNGVMPAWSTLSDKKLAQVITYVRRDFGTLPDGDDGIVTVEMIGAAREMFKDQSGAYNEAQLLAIPEDGNLPGAQVDPLTGEAL